MKRAFTLVEMLIVVALIATLMAIVLRLTSVGADESNRNETIVRLARLENCLSGYYAAYGSYPPVQLHNSRDINESVNGSGVGNSDKTPVSLWSWDAQTFRKDMKASGVSSQDAEKDAWNQVKGACEAQPVALEAPDPDVGDLDDAFKSLCSVVRQNLTSGSFKNYPKQGDSGYDIWNNGFGTIYDNLGGVENEIPWRSAQICKFGLLSFLLPRFQSMMGWPSDKMFDGEGSCIFDQWNANNGTVPHDPFTGEKMTWREVNEKVRTANGSGSSSGNDATIRKARAFLEALPSEAVTARWLPNLEKICSADFTDLQYFGIPINAEDSGGMFEVSGDSSSTPPAVKVYSPEGGDSMRNLYHLNEITVRDGWDTEFFYYSPTPHQSYVLWSAGKNKRTFPPWIPRKGLDSSAQACVAAWTEDDIRGMSN